MASQNPTSSPSHDWSVAAALYRAMAWAMFAPARSYDAVLFAFVLHELPVGDVPPLVERTAAALAPAGRIAVLDHAVPGGFAGRMWRGLLRLIESHSMEPWLALDLPALLRGNGLSVLHDERLAGGRVGLVVAERPAAGRHDRV